MATGQTFFHSGKDNTLTSLQAKRQFGNDNPGIELQLVRHI